MLYNFSEANGEDNRSLPLPGYFIKRKNDVLCITKKSRFAELSIYQLLQFIKIFFENFFVVVHLIRKGGLFLHAKINGQ